MKTITRRVTGSAEVENAEAKLIRGRGTFGSGA